MLVGLVSGAAGRSACGRAFRTQRESAFHINYRGFVAFAAILWNGTGSGSCPVVGLHTSGVEPSGSATRELVN
jgi:hypothetical protein